MMAGRHFAGLRSCSRICGAVVAGSVRGRWTAHLPKTNRDGGAVCLTCTAALAARDFGLLSKRQHLLVRIGLTQTGHSPFL